MRKRLLAGCVFLVALGAAPTVRATPVCTDTYNGGPPRAQCGNRIFPEAHMAQAYIQYTPNPAGFAEYRHGIEYLAASYPRWVSVTTLREIYDDPDAVSAGHDEIRSYLANDSGDGRDIPVIKITDHSVPDDEKQALFFSLSVHGNERGGLEGGVRTAEDLAIAASCMTANNCLPAPVVCANNAEPGCTVSTHLSDGALDRDGNPNYASATGRPPEIRQHAVTDLLKKEVVYMIDFNVDGWAMGDLWGQDQGRTFLYNRGNQIGTDLNRQMPTIGRINPGRNPLQESEMFYGTRLMHDVADASRGGKMAYGADIHGELTSQAYMDVMYPAGQFDSVDHRRLMAIAERTKSVIDKTLYAGIVEEFEQRTVGNEEEAPQKTIPQRPAHWATVWDTLGYTDTGFIGDYMATDLGVTGMDYEIAFNHTVPEKVWNVYLQENHINASRGIIKTAMAYAMSQESDYNDDNVTLDPQGRAGYVVNADTVTDTDENGPGRLAGPGGSGVGQDGVPVEQRPYEVSNQQWFRDTNRLMTRPFAPVGAGDIAADEGALDNLDTLVLADVAAPDDPGGRAYDQAAYWRNIQDWVSRGGNLVLTDRAIGALESMGIVENGKVIAVNTYLPNADFQDLSHPMADGLRANARQLVESAVIGWGILTSETRPQTITVDQAAWEGIGGEIVGTTGTDRVSVGEARFGKGQIRIIGGALPTPIESNDHRYGLRDYAPTYTGLYLLENSIEYDHPDLGNTPPRLGTRLALTGASDTSGDYTDEATLSAKLTDVNGNALNDAVVTFDLLSGGEAVDSWTAATGSSGVVTVPARLLARPGSYTLAARYAGNADTYRPAATSQGFTITREDVAMTLQRTGVGTSARLVARLLDSDSPGDAVAQRIVQFTANSSELGADITDGGGYADVAIPGAFRGGRHTFRASFPGDEWFEPGSQSITSR